MRILITRPAEDAAAFAAALRARGHEAIIEPMLAIAPAPDARGPLDLDGVQAVLFTSANGVRAFAGLSDSRALPAFTVGEASAQAARDAGFAQVESAGGDVDDLARLVTARLDPAAGALLHGAARTRAGDLKGTLEGRGFTVRREILYEAQPARALSGPTRTALRDGNIDAASFFSPRTAQTFVELVQEAGLAESMASADAACLSAAVADRVRVLPWRRIRVAAQPDQEALLDCIDSLIDSLAVAHEVRSAEESMPSEPPPQDKTDDETPQAPARSEAAAEESPAHDIISRFGGIRPMAHKLGIAVSTVQGWRERDSIPTARHPQIAAAAESHGITLDPDRLAASDRHPDGHGEPEAAPTAERVSAAEAPEAERATPWAAPGEEATGEAAQGEGAPPGAIPEAETVRRSAYARPWVSTFLIVALVFLAGAAGAVLTREAWLGLVAGEDTRGARIEALERRLAELEARPAGAPEGELNQARNAISNLRSEIESLNARLTSLGRIAESAGNAEQLGAALAQMEARNAKIEKEVSDLRGEIAEANARLESLGNLAQATGQSETLSAAIAELEGRNAALAKEISALRTELSTLAAARAEAPASESAIALAILQMRDALRGAEPFAHALEALDAVLSDAEGGEAAALRAAVAPLRKYAKDGAPSLESLQAAFPAVARAVIAQARGGEDEGMLSNALRRLSRLVSVRRVGPVEGDSAEAIVARAEAHLQAGDLASALSELDALSGPAAEAAADWRAKAEARRDAQQALAELGRLLAAWHTPDKA